MLRFGGLTGTLKRVDAAPKEVRPPMQISVLMLPTMGLATESVAESSIVAISEVSGSDVALGEDATDSIALHEADGAPTDRVARREADGAPHGLNDAPRESIEAANEEEGGRSFFARFGGRRLLLPLACVAAFLVGFGSVTAVMKLTDRPAQSDAKPVPTTAPPSAPAITTPPTTAARTPAVQSQLPPPAPEPTAAPEPAPAPQAGASQAPPSSSSSPTTVTNTTPNTTTASP
jgi:hypothetical protein